MKINEINEIKELCHKYGSSITLGDLLSRVQGNKIHECPKCEGKGYVTRCIQGSCDGWTPDRYIDEMCDLCKGIGYTEHEYKPRMIQNGWE